MRVAWKIWFTQTCSRWELTNAELEYRGNRDLQCLEVTKPLWWKIWWMSANEEEPCTRFLCQLSKFIARLCLGRFLTLRSLMPLHGRKGNYDSKQDQFSWTFDLFDKLISFSSVASCIWSHLFCSFLLVPLCLSFVFVSFCCSLFFSSLRECFSTMTKVDSFSSVPSCISLDRSDLPDYIYDDPHEQGKVLEITGFSFTNSPRHTGLIMMTRMRRRRKRLHDELEAVLSWSHF